MRSRSCNNASTPHGQARDTTPAGHDSNIHENVARHLLLTADEFNVADCRNEAQVYEAKEAIFRRYDNDLDGVLSHDEIIAALVRHSADTHIPTCAAMVSPVSSS